MNSVFEAEGIRVTTAVPCGNACDVEIRSEGGMPEISFAADPHGGYECMWFCLRLQKTGNSGPADRIRLVLKHSATMLGGGFYPDEDRRTLRPVVRISGGAWERLGEGEIVEHADGRVDVAWTASFPGPVLDLAFSHPYGQEEISRLVRECGGFWRTDAIGVTQEGRPLLRISNRLEGKGIPGFYLMAREHAGEAPGSWVLDGLLREMARIGGRAPMIWCVPFVDPDGVAQGDYGKDRPPWDPGRAWGDPAMRHENLVIKADMLNWKERCNPALAASFHAQAACEADGFYCMLPDANEPEARAAAEKWEALIAEGLGEYARKVKRAHLNPFGNRWNGKQMRWYAWSALETPALVVESPYSMMGEKILGVEDYLKAGAGIAGALLKGA